MTETPARASETRQRLGRGLAALLGEAKPAAETSEQYRSRQVPVEFLRASARNPRQTFNDAELDELAGSIRERGIIQPIVVRPVAGVEDSFEIIAGERRWRAAQRAGLHTVPIIVLNISDREALELSIVENVQRADLNALEEARGYSQLASEYGYSHTDIGRIIGKSRSHIANTLRLMGLPEHSRELLASGAITAGHARALLSLPNPDAIADRIVSQGLTVREVEKLHEVASPTQPTPKSAPVTDPNIQALEQRLSSALGAKVGIKSKRKTFQLIVQLKTLEQLEYVCEKISS
jgi:ParB family chromosome partitioning protein